MFIPLNPHAYSPKTPVNGSPKQANQTVGDGFFTAPGRTTSGKLLRAVSPSFEDVWSQPRLFYNSLVPAEQQFVIDAIRFENANLKSPIVKNNVIIQLNRIDNALARRVARAIGVTEPEPDPTYYHNNKTVNVGTFGTKLKKLDGLKVGFLASVQQAGSVDGASNLRDRLSSDGVDVVVVAERLADGVDQTYSTSDAIQFDAVIVAPGAESLFETSSFTAGSANATSGAGSLYPAGRPLQILIDGFRFGKTVGALGSGSAALRNAGIAESRDGVFVAQAVTDEFANGIQEGLRTFKFLDRFPVDH
jgi:catalase